MKLSRYYFLTSILVTLLLIFPGQALAGDIDAKLTDTSNASSFQVKDSADKVLMKVQSGGNVGIGTTTPTYKLHLVDGEFMIHNGTYDLSFSAGPPGVISAYYGIDIKSMTTSRLRIQSDGNVGIGTTEPKEKLQVGDSLTIHDGGWKIISYNAYYDGTNDIRMASGFASAMAFSDSGDIRFRTAGTGSAGDVLDMGAYSTWESGTPPLIVKNDGNIGIGTTDQFGGGAGVLSLGNAATPPTSVLTNAAALYASGGELYAYNAAGTATKISPHDPETGEWIFFSKNTKTGRVVRVNMEKLVKKIEELTGERFMEEWVEEVRN